MDSSRKSATKRRSWRWRRSDAVVYPACHEALKLLAIMGLRAPRANRCAATSAGQASYRPGSVSVRPITPWSVIVA